jgi:hypothetical protein
MSKRTSKSRPTWIDVKDKLASFDRSGLLGMVQDLYDAHKDNQMFLHSRLGLGEDILKPYKQTIERWVSPDVFRDDQRTSVTKAKQAISSYKKAVGDAAGLAELMVFYCERASDFSCSYGNDDVDYLNALVRMFDQALATATTLPADSQAALRARLEQVCENCHNLGYGVGDSMDDILADYT